MIGCRVSATTLLPEPSNAGASTVSSHTVCVFRYWSKLRMSCTCSAGERSRWAALMWSKIGCRAAFGTHEPPPGGGLDGMVWVGAVVGAVVTGVVGAVVAVPVTVIVAFMSGWIEQ